MSPSVPVLLEHPVHSSLGPVSTSHRSGAAKKQNQSIKKPLSSNDNNFFP